MPNYDDWATHESRDGATWRRTGFGSPFMPGLPRMTTSLNGIRWELCSWSFSPPSLSSHRYKIAFWIPGSGGFGPLGKGPQLVFDTNDKEEAIAFYTQIVNYPLTEMVLAVI